VLDILRDVTGLGDIVWRPSESMMREEGVEPASEADTAEQTVRKYHVFVTQSYGMQLWTSHARRAGATSRKKFHNNCT